LDDFDGKYGDLYDEQVYCEHQWSIAKLSPTVFEGHCEKCGLTTTQVLNYEYWHENQKEDPFIRVGGRRYRALKSWGNIAPCSECGKVFFEVPLIIWSEKDPSKAIVFCPNCAEGIISPVLKARKEKP